MSSETATAETFGETDYSDETSTFGDRLALAREAAGLSQAQLAGRLGVKPQTLRNWEEDRAAPRSSRLQILAGLLNVSMVWLMSGRGDPPSEPSARGEIRSLLADLQAVRAGQVRLAEDMARLERRLRLAAAD